MSKESFLLLGRPLLLLDKGNVVKVDHVLPGASILGAFGLGLAAVDSVTNVSAAATGLVSVQTTPSILCWLLAILGMMFLVGVVAQHAAGWCGGFVFLVALFSSLFLLFLAFASLSSDGSVSLFLFGLFLVFSLLRLVSVVALPHVEVGDNHSEVVYLFFQKLQLLLDGVDQRVGFINKFLVLLLPGH